VKGRFVIQTVDPGTVKRIYLILVLRRVIVDLVMFERLKFK